MAYPTVGVPHWTSAFSTLVDSEARLSRPGRDPIRFRDGSLRPDRPRLASLSMGFSTRSEADLRRAPTNKEGQIVPAYRRAREEATPPWLTPEEGDARLFKSASMMHFAPPISKLRPGSALPPHREQAEKRPPGPVPGVSACCSAARGPGSARGCSPPYALH